MPCCAKIRRPGHAFAEVRCASAVIHETHLVNVGAFAQQHAKPTTLNVARAWRGRWQRVKGTDGGCRGPRGLRHVHVQCLTCHYERPTPVSRGSQVIGLMAGQTYAYWSPGLPCTHWNSTRLQQAGMDSLRGSRAGRRRLPAAGRSCI